jgi:hypothetical protein
MGVLDGNFGLLQLVEALGGQQCLNLVMCILLIRKCTARSRHCESSEVRGGLEILVVSQAGLKVLKGIGVHWYKARMPTYLKK